MWISPGGRLGLHLAIRVCCFDSWHTVINQLGLGSTVLLPPPAFGLLLDHEWQFHGHWSDSFHFFTLLLCDNNFLGKILYQSLWTFALYIFTNSQAAISDGELHVFLHASTYDLVLSFYAIGIIITKALFFVQSIYVRLSQNLINLGFPT